MDGTRPQQPLTDWQLERELETALGVEPSPDFLARVRTRIANEPETSAWRLPLAAVAIVGIVLAVVVPPWIRTEQPATRPATADVRLPAAQRSDLKVGSAGPVHHSAGLATVARIAPRLDQVEVIVSRDEQQALQALIRVSYEGRMPALPEASREMVIDVPDLMIAPLVIEHLPQVARIETEGENRW